jgi:hypothetical protein
MTKVRVTKLRHLLVAGVFALTLAPLCHGGAEFRVLHNFGPIPDGAMPTSPPLLRRGHLYGLTYDGGTSQNCEQYGCGTLYELTRSGGQVTESVLYDFDSSDLRPNGNLVADAGGSLYGVVNGFGSEVFELSPGSGGWSFSSIYEGAAPGLTIDGLGNIYGLIGGGLYGAMGELSPVDGGFNYTDLYNFCDPNNCFIGGGHPNPVTMDFKGNLYGTTYYAGADNDGVAYQLRRGSDGAGGAQWSLYLMHTFGWTQEDGTHPYGGLTVDQLGNAYGTTAEGGGVKNGGTVFELTPALGSPGTWVEKQLYNFPNLLLGGGPGGNLVFDQAGNLYGTAGGGDLSCPLTCGVVFRLSPQGDGNWNYTVVHKFTGADGYDPIGLAIDESGDLFGTTTGGGTYNGGVVFMITP